MSLPHSSFQNPIDVKELYRTLPRFDALLALVAFYEHEDMVHAANALGLSQPALSFQLKKLEETLEFELFTFQGKKKVLTRLGIEYVKCVQKNLFRLNEDTKHILKQAQNLESQHIRIAGRRELLLPLLSFTFPGTLEWIQTSSEDAMTLLRQRKIDLAVSAHVHESHDLISKVFFQSTMKLVHHKSLKLDRTRLDQYPVVAYGAHSAYLREFASGMGLNFDALKIHRQVEDWFSVVELIRLRQGWGVIPQAWETHGQEMIEEPISEKIIPAQKIYLFFLKDERKSRWVESLEAWLKNR